jgi:hypothetical protein
MARLQPARERPRPAQVGTVSLFEIRNGAAQPRSSEVPGGEAAQGVVFTQDSKTVIVQFDVERALAVYAIRDEQARRHQRTHQARSGPVSIRLDAALVRPRMPDARRTPRCPPAAAEAFAGQPAGALLTSDEAALSMTSSSTKARAARTPAPTGLARRSLRRSRRRRWSRRPASRHRAVAWLKRCASAKPSALLTAWFAVARDAAAASGRTCRSTASAPRADLLRVEVGAQRVVLEGIRHAGQNGLNSPSQWFGM